MLAGDDTYCLLNATIGHLDVPPITFGNDYYVEVLYKYDHCPNNSSTQLFFCAKKRIIGCFCMWEPFYATLFFDAFVCNVNEVKALACCQIVAALLGFALNILVLTLFAQRKKIRNKVGNILLASQAVVDLFNTAFNSIPTGLMWLILPNMYYRMSEDDEVLFEVAILALYLFSFNSSVFTFTLIALERYLSFSKPLWHRQHVTKGWILKKLIIVSVVAVLATFFEIYICLAHNMPLLCFGLVLLISWIAMVTVLFSLSFAKAWRHLRRRDIRYEKDRESQNDIDQTNIQKDAKQIFAERKIFRLTMIFFAMYGVFLLGLVPLVVVVGLWYAEGQKYGIPDMVNCFLLAVTSIINPLLTLCLKEDFKLHFFGNMKRDIESELNTKKKLATVFSSTSTIDTPPEPRQLCLSTTKPTIHSLLK